MTDFGTWLLIFQALFINLCVDAIQVKYVCFKESHFNSVKLSFHADVEMAEMLILTFLNGSTIAQLFLKLSKQRKGKKNVEFLEALV